MSTTQKIAAQYMIYVNGETFPLNVNPNNKTWEGSATYGSGTYTVSDGKVIWDDDGGYLQRNGASVSPADEIINGGQYTTLPANIEINITSNGTTTLATAGKLCNSNIDVKVNVPQAEPIEVSTAAAMNALLVAGNVGKVYKFTGTTDSSYTNGDLYEVVSE